MPLLVPSSSPEPLLVPSSSPEPLLAPSSSPEPLLVPSSSPEPLLVPSSSPEPLLAPSSSPEPRLAPSSSPEPLLVPSSSPEPLLSPSNSPEPLPAPSGSPEYLLGNFPKEILGGDYPPWPPMLPAPPWSPESPDPPWPPKLSDPPWPPEFPDPPWPPELPDPPWPPESPDPPRPPESSDPPWPPESPDPPWPPELPAPPWLPERAPPWRPPVLSCLRVPWGLQSAHPPSPFDVIRRGTRLLEGGGNVRLSLSVSCVSPPLVPIFGQFLFLSSFVIISSQPCVFSWLVPSPVLLIILFAPFPSLYKSSVFPVSLSSINVIPQCPVGMCTCAPAISLYLNKVCEGSSTSPRSWHPVHRDTEDLKKRIVALYKDLKIKTWRPWNWAVLENNSAHTKYWHFGPKLYLFTMGCTHFCGQRSRHYWLCVELFWGDSKFTLLYKLYTHYFTL